MRMRVSHNTTEKSKYMEIKKLEAFKLAVDLGSFSKAADRLGITQSGLTHMMNSLEKEIGFSILTRDFNGVKPTPNGQKIIPAVDELIASSKKLENEINYINEAADKTITIGSYTSVSIAWVLPIIKEFNKEFPDINVEIRGGTISENYNWVKEGFVDLSFASNQFDPEVEFMHLNYDPLIAVLPPDYNVVSDTFDVMLLDKQKVIMPSFGFENDILRELNKYNIHPIFRPTVVDDEVILKMVEAKLGIGILSELIMNNKTYDVIAMPLSPAMSRDLGIVVKEYDKLRDFVKIFIEYAKNYTKNL